MLVKDNIGLIVVYIQGKLPRLDHESEQQISNCAKLIKGAEALDLPIILVEQNPEKLGSTVDELSTLIIDIEPIIKFPVKPYQNRANNCWQSVIPFYR